MASSTLSYAPAVLIWPLRCEATDMTKSHANSLVFWSLLVRSTTTSASPPAIPVLLMSFCCCIASQSTLHTGGISRCELMSPSVHTRTTHPWFAVPVVVPVPSPASSNRFIRDLISSAGCIRMRRGEELTIGPAPTTRCRRRLFPTNLFRYSTVSTCDAYHASEILFYFLNRSLTERRVLSPKLRLGGRAGPSP